MSRGQTRDDGGISYSKADDADEHDDSAAAADDAVDSDDKLLTGDEYDVVRSTLSIVTHEQSVVRPSWSVTVGAGGNGGDPAAAARCERRDRSKSISWPMKLKLGDTSGLQRLTWSYASLSDRSRACIRYATVTVTERLMPARQCTSTPHSF